MSGQVLNDKTWTAPWAQIEWLTGNNAFATCPLFRASCYNNPIPHSCLLGTTIQRFHERLPGTEEDIPYVDLLRECECPAPEYNTPPRKQLSGWHRPV